MLDYRLMTIDDYGAAYDLWIICGHDGIFVNGSNETAEQLSESTMIIEEVI